MDLTKKITQANFAKLVGITQPAVSSLVARGILKVGDAGDIWLLAYCSHLRETAAGRIEQEKTGLDLDEERARLTAAQADKVEMENEVTRAQLAPVSILESVLNHAGAKISALLETIPAGVKRRSPELSERDIGYIQREIVKARNSIATLSLEDIEEEDSDGEE